ncbi:MAG: S24 family peptidase [Rhodothermales bacterium]|nr:S24 family peptidase [Rhodothermales bacterium]
MPARVRLTERQNQAFEFIRSYMRRHRKPPTLREIGDALGIRSTNGVHKLVGALEAKGYVEREANAARGLRLVDAERDPFALDDGTPTLMVVSRTASDQPDRLRQRPTAYFAVDPYFLRGVGDVEACFIGRAGDDGMNGDGIRKGDFVVVEEVPREDLRNGEVAAFLVGEELRVRRYHFANDRVHLRPADRHYTEEMFSPDDPGCYVAGRVIGLLRRL